MEVLGITQGLSTEPISRRRFITVAGVGAALATVDARGFLASPLTSDGDDLTLTLLDPDSQLRLVFRFINLDHDLAGNRLVAASSGNPRVRIELPPQHTSEQAVAAGVTPATGPIAHRNAGASRLVFDVTPPIDLTVDGLLDLASFSLRTTAVVGDPNDGITMIELPADLRWSPGSDVVVTPESGPTSAAGVTQLHRLHLEAPGVIEVVPVHNASSSDPFTFRVPNAASRDSIVASASAAAPAVAEHVRLTSQGAWASINGDWNSTSWIQRVQGGRDQFAQVVERGVLMPFGHEAVWTQTNTRLWIADTSGSLVSVLVSEEHFAVVGGVDKTFPGTYSPFGGRNMPFRTVTVFEEDNVSARKGVLEWEDDFEVPQTLSTADAWAVEIDSPGSFWDGYRIKVDYSAVDSADNEPYPFALQAVFVSQAGLAKSSVRNKLAGFYASDEGEDARLMFSSLRDVAWAEPLSAGDPVTTLGTTRLQIGLVPITGPSNAQLEAAGQLRLQPVIVGGEVSYSGTNGVQVEFAEDYLEHGNSETLNPKLAFLDILGLQTFPVGAEARSIMTPDLVAEQFNQTLGVGPKFEDSSGTGSTPDTWNPADAFGEAAQILRGVKLADIVGPILLDVAIDGIDIPGFEIERLSDRIVQSYTWCPPNINSVELAGFIADADTSLCVSIDSVVALDPSVETSATVEFRVSEFTLIVPPVIDLVRLEIRELRAVQTTTGTPDLTFDVASWALGGNLAWMERLLDLLTPAGSDFDIDISSESIGVDLAISLPDINLGMLKITNFAIGLFGSFPFTGGDEPRIGIGLGSRSAPVSLQILQFGGGFSVEVEFSAQGVELLVIKAFVSARLVEIDIVIAQAYCEVAISAVFKGSDAGFVGELSLTAHFNVLGVIGATLSIVGRVKYKASNETITISGTIHWSVTAVLTFSGKVPIGSFDFKIGNGSAGNLRRGRAAGAGGGGGGGDPAGSFGSAHTFATWNEYVDAFPGEV